MLLPHLLPSVPEEDVIWLRPVRVEDTGVQVRRLTDLEPSEEP